MSAFRFPECEECVFHNMEPAICEQCVRGSEFTPCIEDADAYQFMFMELKDIDED